MPVRALVHLLIMTSHPKTTQHAVRTDVTSTLVAYVMYSTNFIEFFEIGEVHKLFRSSKVSNFRERKKLQLNLSLQVLSVIVVHADEAKITINIAEVVLLANTTASSQSIPTNFKVTR